MKSSDPKHPSDWEEAFKARIRKELRPKFSESDHPRRVIEHWIENFSHNNFAYVSEEAEKDIMENKETAIPLLIEATRSKNEKSRYQSIHYLLKLGDSRAREVFKERLDDDWGQTIIDSAEGLFKIGDRDIAISRLVEVFLDKNIHRHTRVLAAKKLMELGVRKAISKGEYLNLENIPPNHHNEFKQLYEELS